MNNAEKVAEYLKQGGLLANWQQVTVAMQDLHHAVATVRYADSGPRQWHVLSKDGFTNEALWNVYEVKLPQDSPAGHPCELHARESQRLQPDRLALTDAEREAIECGIQAIGLAPYDERTLAYAATLRGLLERTRNGAVDGRETVQ
jgi:hypothetical protein